MRKNTMRHIALAVLVAGLAAPAAILRAAEPAKGDARLQALVRQLGSDSYEERQQASAFLEKAGEPALPLLREALNGTDMEVRRRAETLITRIEIQVATARALTPLRLRFVCKDMPVTEAVAEFAKQTGHPIQWSGDATKLAQQRITLDTGETTFWDAFQQLCAKAGIRESDAPQQPQPNQYGDFSGRVIRARGGVRVWSGNYYGPQRSFGDPTLVVEAGAAPAAAVASNGSLRVRALPPKSGALSDLPDGGKQVTLHLEMRAESRIELTELIGLRVTRATDDSGHKVRHATDYIESGPGNYFDGDMVFIANSIEMYDPNGSGGLRQIPITVVVDGKSAHKLGELSGVLCARVRTAPEPLVTVDDVAKAIGKTHVSVDGGEVKITESRREDDGLLKIKVELKTNQPADAANEIIQMKMGGRLRAVRMGGMVAGQMPKIQLTKDNPNGMPFKLYSAKGQALEFVSGELEMGGNMDGSGTYTLVFKPGANDTAPAKLEYIGRRESLVEMPFTLKDVPLAPTDR
jgi:hypothetical protein